MGPFGQADPQAGASPLAGIWDYLRTHNLISKLLESGAAAPAPGQPSPLQQPQGAMPAGAPPFISSQFQQGGNEPDAVFGARRIGGSILDGVANALDPSTYWKAPEGGVGPVQQDIVTSARNAFSTPNSRNADQGKYIDAAWRGMLRQEGGSNPDGSFRRSPAGAWGPAQLMPGTLPEAAKLAGLDPKLVATDRNANIAAGRAYFGMLIKKFNGNIPQAVAAYNAGPGKMQQVLAGKANMPAETVDYLHKVAGFAQNFGAPFPSFAPVEAGFDQAAGQFGAARDAAKQPFSVTTDITAPPALPTPQLAVAPDTSAGDAAFANAAPRDPFNDPKERGRIKLNGILKGIGQAALGAQGASNFGQLMFAIGAGALAGRGMGEDQIRDKQEQYEQHMIEYQRALANRDDAKAANIANVANSNAQTLNAHAVDQWRVNMQQWEKNEPRVENGILYTTKVVGDKRTITGTPIGNAAEVGYHTAMAQLALQKGSAINQHNVGAFEYGQGLAQTGLNMALRLSMQQGDSGSANDAMATAVAMRVAPMVESRTLGSIIGQDKFNSLLQAANKAAGITDVNMTDPSFHPNDDQQKVINQFMTTEATKVFLGDASMRSRLVSRSAIAAKAADRTSSYKATRRTDASGRPSFSESW
jgi:hypothetical protein